MSQKKTKTAHHFCFFFNQFSQLLILPVSGEATSPAGSPGEEQKLFIIPQQQLQPASRNSVNILLSTALTLTRLLIRDFFIIIIWYFIIFIFTSGKQPCVQPCWLCHMQCHQKKQNTFTVRWCFVGVAAGVWLVGWRRKTRKNYRHLSAHSFFLFYCQLTREECIYTQVHIDTRTISRHLALNKHPLKHKQHSAITPDPSSFFLKRSKADKQQPAYVLNSRSHFIF